MSWISTSRPRSATVGLAAISMAALGLAACGTSSANTATGTNGELAKVQSTHQLSIAMSSFAPQDFQNSDGTWTGYDVDILNGFAKSLGAKLTIDSIPFSSAVEAVSTHKDDITIDIFYTSQRAQAIAYSRPMLNYNDVVAVSVSKPQVTSPALSALSGKTVTVVSGSEEVGEANKIPNAHVVQYSDLNSTLLAVSQGRAAADLEPGSDIAWAMHKNPSLGVKILGAVPSSIAPPIATLRGYYAVPKGSYSSQFLSKLNAYLKKIACDGTEQTYLNKYGMTEPVFLKGICQAPNAYSG